MSVGDWKGAVREYQKAGNDYDGYIAEVLYDAGDLDGAAAEIRKILETNPNSQGANYFLARIFMERADYEAALEEYRKVVWLQESARSIAPLSRDPKKISQFISEYIALFQTRKESTLSSSITFDNLSGKDAVIKLTGPSPQTVRLSNAQSTAIQVSPGDYFLFARYGIYSKEFIYAKGGPIHVKQTDSQHSIIRITLHQPSENDLAARQEFGEH